ncbi:hypothetical protein M011DRAFT_529899 [Sporormia fimetaria CBS 119925]|uniref:Uncharacterized protein n=1 Tax=Sporormia fimetaria CBS 119925 TaxID=1340428 RepID=A0A6A6UZ22_9PLEO|nr:hypothetical protein M011DRAFT_529899 [Sporormia fimetaria CBS 119925]
MDSTQYSAIEPYQRQAEHTTRLKSPTSRPHTDSTNEEPIHNTDSYVGVLPITKRIALHLSAGAGASIAVLLAAVAFLTFLWHCDSTNSIWHRIVLVNWVTRSVTLTALALRASASLLAGIATSMLASLVIEGTGIRLDDIPELSMMRLSNTGPHSLLWAYVKQTILSYHLMLALLLTITTLAAQLSSTLLLSDVATKHILGPAFTATYAYSFNANGTNNNNDMWRRTYWDQMVTEYPAFGEYVVEPQPEDGINDTGSSLRAFISVPDQSTRESLYAYQGLAYVFDARAACVQPDLLSFQIDRSFTNLTYYPADYVSGKVVARHSPVDSKMHHTPLSLAAYFLTARTFIGTPALAIALEASEQVTGISRGRSNPYAGLPPRKIRVSLCYTAIWDLDGPGPNENEEYYNISLNRASPAAEPPRARARANGFDTSSIRRQLGASKSYSMQERGIFTLSNQEIQAEVGRRRGAFQQREVGYSPRLDTPVTWDVQFNQWIMKTGSSSPATLWFCSHCERLPVRGDNYGGLYRDAASAFYSKVFLDVLNETDSPALALQVHFTSTLRDVFYTWLPLYDTMADSTAVIFVGRLAPVSRRGFWTVMGVICAHLSICSAVTVAFFTKTNFSMLGNAWVSSRR